MSEKENNVSQIPEYDPDTMTIHACESCGNYEPVADDFTLTPYCHSCASVLKPDETADRYAEQYGFNTQHH